MFKLIPVNLPQRITQLNSLRSRTPRALGVRLRKLAEDPILKESKRLVPVDTGALRSTGKVHPLKKLTGMQYKVDITYGGQADEFKKRVKYAIIQHENLRFLHPKGGMAKFLEIPVFMYSASVIPKNLIGRVAELTRKFFKGGSISD